MSKLELFETNGKQKGKIVDAVFCYIKLQEGGLKYQSKTEREYTLDCIVDKATAKAFKKAFPKNSVKEIDTPEFEAKFKIAPPFPKEDEQYVIKVKAKAQLSADAVSAGLSKGEDIPYEWTTRPKVFVPVDGGVSDVTMDVLVANGSRGDVAFNITSNDFGTFPQLTGILVKDLIEYQSEGGSSSDFGEVVGGLKPGNGETKQKADAGVNKEEDASEANPPPHTDADVPDDDFDTDVPF
jgi:hypothetical protein